MKKQYLSEIIDHPLLGKLLPVDFSPLKTCSFNCYYCSLGNTTKISIEREEFYPFQDIFQEIDAYLQKKTSFLILYSLPVVVNLHCIQNLEN